MVVSVHGREGRRLVSTVAVLAGGTGSRFAASYPKELHVLAPGVSVIDPLMTSIMALTPTTKALVVVSTAKLALISHLHRFRGQCAFVFQQPQHGSGLPAALRAARPWCDDTVLICLADQVYLSDPGPAFTAALSMIGTGAPMAVVATECADPDRLRHEGALTVTDAAVTAAAEKPHDPTGFNACWSALAMTRTMLSRLADDLDAGHTGCLVGAPVVWGPEFVNINHPADAALATVAYPDTNR